MTTKELNRDIKRLYNEHYHMTFQDNDAYFKYVEEKAKPELNRLYYADDKLNCVSLSSLKMLIRLDLRLRVIPFHQFGLKIKL